MTPTERIAGQHREHLPQLALETCPADLVADDRIGVPHDLDPLLGDLADVNPVKAGPRLRVERAQVLHGCRQLVS